MNREAGIVLSALISCFVACTAHADDSDEHLLGAWGGMRPQFEAHGVDVQALLTYDAVANVQGGVKRKFGGLYNLDLTASLDTKEAGLWDGGTLFLYVLGNGGAKPSSFVGDNQVTDNIEAPATYKIYELFYDHSFLDDRFSVLVGLHDYNTEFASLKYDGDLINSSFGVQRDISQVGPSIFPTTSLALRLKAQLDEHWYAQGAVYDGVPGNPNRTHGTQLILKRSDGIFAAVESGLASAEQDPRYFKYAVGGWYLNHRFDDFSETSRADNGGLYLIAERQLYAEEQDAHQGLGAFLQLGKPHGDRNQIGGYAGLGMSYTGLIPERDCDEVVFGIAHARTSAEYRRAVAGSTHAETAFELAYRAKLLPYLTRTPDAQYVVHPGTTDALNDALVLMTRVELAL